MKNTKLIALLCSMLVLLLLLGSCGGDDAQETTPETSAGTEALTDAETTALETQTDESVSAEQPSDEPQESVETPTEAATDYFEANRVETVKPDELKSPDVAIAGDGYDIYQMKEDQTWGYRYGCTYLYNDDGSIDAYFACPGADGEWDWIAYRHSPDGG
ncbi:MAG: hypothetical protein J6D87_01490, partial [Clostridia bacterium]|nr:hypothetical protein [Clostridia bacterium]